MKKNHCTLRSIGNESSNFCQGNGTNFEVLADKFAKRKLLKFSIAFCNHPNAPVIKELKNLTFLQKHLQLKNAAINQIMKN